LEQVKISIRSTAVASISYRGEVATHDLSETATAERALRERGIRVTAPRLAVLGAVHQFPHADTDTVARAVRDRLGAVSTQAVYDALALFAEVGLVRRIQPAGSAARYETRVDDNHHHVICRRCGVMSDVDCALRPAPCLIPSDPHGIVIDEAEVVYWGLCTSCRIESEAD
jgi:Fur family ferric uptake transcriptional regulator